MSCLYVGQFWALAGGEEATRGNLSVSVQMASKTVGNHRAEHQVNITSHETLHPQCLFPRDFLNAIYV